MAGDRATLLVMATGLGKTHTFVEIARLAAGKGRRVLVLAHRTELLGQALGKLATAGVEAALEQGPARAGDAAVAVASVATLRGKRLAAWPTDAFDLIVIDEAHHATATTYRAIIDHFTGARILGVTATPDRADGRGLGEVFQSVAYRYELRQAIADGWLAPIKARRIRLDVDLDAIGTRAGDLNPGELAAVMTQPAIVAATAAALLAEVGARPFVLFSVDVAHAEALAAAVNLLRPGCTRAVSGRSTDEERAAIAVDLAAGTLQGAVNCALLTEGWDCPDVACVALARPTKSRPLFTQCVGRGTRLAPGKTDLLVLDFTNNSKRHRLVSAADVLAGQDLTDEEAQLAAEAMETEAVDPALVIEQARAAAAEHLRLGVRRWVVEEVGDLLGERIELDERDRGDLATPAQRDAVRRAGFDDVPVALTRAAASRILDLVRTRREDGRATVPQVRLLRRFGVDGAEWVSFVAATRMIDEMIAERRRWQEAMR